MTRVMVTHVELSIVTSSTQTKNAGLGIRIVDRI